MKLSTEFLAPIEKSGIQESSEFTIDFNAKMARILSDKLYSDKVQSIIRELSCNAIDSHVAAGKADVPIHVHLPTVFEPWFSVTDYGVGLDHDGIKSHFTRYGSSTKTNSNLLIGSLGLGCKSPFSYVDAFDVTAIKDGVKRHYSMFKDEEGMPDWALINEGVTNEPNGVTVKMPVKNSDFYDFVNKSKLVFRWFPVKPVITGRDENAEIKQDVEFSGNGWKILENLGYGSDPVFNTPMALMGNVAYPLHVASIQNLSPLMTDLLKIPFILEFNIGDLEVSASRESLGYDMRTQRNIKDKLTLVMDDVRSTIQASFDSCKNLYDAKVKLAKLTYKSKNSHFYSSMQKSSPLKFCGEEIKNTNLSFEIKDMVVRTSNKLGYVKDDYIQINCREDSIFIIDDSLTNGLKKSKHYLQTNKLSPDYVYYFKPNNRSLADITQQLHGAPYILTSTIELPASVRSATTYVKNDVFYLNKDAMLVATTADLTLEEVYIPVRHNTPIYGEKDLDLKDAAGFIHHCRSVGIIKNDQKVYFVRKGIMKSIENDSNWTCLFSVAQQWVKSNFNSQFYEQYKDVHAYDQLVRDDRTNMLWNKKIMMDLDDSNGAFAKFVAGMQSLSLSYQTFNTQKNHATVALKEFFEPLDKSFNPAYNSNKKLHNNVIKTYPLITELRYCPAKMIFDYINLVDRDVKNQNKVLDSNSTMA
jgi:hypothetical protein